MKFRKLIIENYKSFQFATEIRSPWVMMAGVSS
jgi:hypothetical protein